MPPARDIIVVGGSAGALQAGSELLARLPEDFPAAVFVTIHLSPGSRGAAAMLDRAGALPVRFAVDGEPVVGGTVLMAPPDHHLLLIDGRVALGRGPRENRTRPAVDPLFRSAARAYGDRVVAVVLSGALSDGATGLHAVEAAGGLALVQAPDEAVVENMPRAAIEYDAPSVVGSVRQLAERLVEVAGPLRPTSRGGDDPADPSTDDRIALLATDHLTPPTNAHRSAFACPEYGGVLWEPDEEHLSPLRCRVRQAYLTDELLAEQAITIEGAVWTAVRALEEQVELAERLAERASDQGQHLVAQRFRDRETDGRDAVAVLTDLLRLAPWAGGDEWGEPQDSVAG
jgi:two-component system chemotaxis response regulator CheB